MKRDLAPTLKGTSLAIVLFAAASGSVAQDVARPPLRVPEVAGSAAEFVPRGWRLEKETVKEADLNSDGQTDVAFVISNGGPDGVNANEPDVVKHVLVIALRGTDGKLHRSMVSDAAVLDGDEGGVFGDPFQDLAIERGAVVITHYGGSRDRWGLTHRYRFQNGQWTLIGLSLGNTDSLDVEHYDNQDINLSTGLVEASARGELTGRVRPPEISGSYYELEVSPVERAPKVDGRVSSNEWPGYTVRLTEKLQVIRNRQLWSGVNDLSAKLHAVRFGEDLFLCAEVTDNEINSGDTVRLVTKRGFVIKPSASRMLPADKGYVSEARYSLKQMAAALKTDNKYIAEELETILDPSGEIGDPQGFPLPVSVEVIDVDNSATPKARAVLSTRLLGSPYPGSVRIFRRGTLVLVSDVK